jgi:hypothetical protein
LLRIARFLFRESRSRSCGHLAKGGFVIDRAVAPDAKRLDLIEHIALDEPPMSRRIDSSSKDCMEVSGFNRTKVQPTALADEYLRADGKSPIPTSVIRTFKVEPDFFTFQDRNARALGKEEGTQRIAKCITVGVIGKEAISQPSKFNGDALLDLDGMRNEAMVTGKSAENEHGYSPAGQSSPAFLYWGGKEAMRAACAQDQVSCVLAGYRSRRGYRSRANASRAG